MTRRRVFLKTLLGSVVAIVTLPAHALTAGLEKLRKPLSEWRRLLARDAYRVLFEEATERAGSSPLNDEKRPGTFVCAGCYLPIFDASTKFESGTGLAQLLCADNRPARDQAGLEARDPAD
jgi:peptide-methionine (R)-S-oxide reductase